MAKEGFYEKNIKPVVHLKAINTNRMPFTRLKSNQWEKGTLGFAKVSQCKYWKRIIYMVYFWHYKKC